MGFAPIYFGAFATILGSLPSILGPPNILGSFFLPFWDPHLGVLGHFPALLGFPGIFWGSFLLFWDFPLEYFGVFLLPFLRGVCHHHFKIPPFIFLGHFPTILGSSLPPYTLGPFPTNLGTPSLVFWGHFPPFWDPTPPFWVSSLPFGDPPIVFWGHFPPFWGRSLTKTTPAARGGLFYSSSSVLLAGSGHLGGGGGGEGHYTRETLQKQLKTLNPPSPKCENPFKRPQNAPARRSCPGPAAPGGSACARCGGRGGC